MESVIAIVPSAGWPNAAAALIKIRTAGIRVLTGIGISISVPLLARGAPYLLYNPSSNAQDESLQKALRSGYPVRRCNTYECGNENCSSGLRQNPRNAHPDLHAHQPEGYRSQNHELWRHRGL